MKSPAHPEGPFHVSRSSDGKHEWFSARDPRSGVSIRADSKDMAEGLALSLNGAFSLLFDLHGVHVRATERERCARIVEAGLGRTNTAIARAIREGEE